MPSNLDLLVPTAGVVVEEEEVEADVGVEMPNLSALSNLFNSSFFRSSAESETTILSSSFLMLPLFRIEGFVGSRLEEAEAEDGV
jgi:hypothetical protein